MKKIFHFILYTLCIMVLHTHFASAQTGASLLFKTGDYITVDTSLGNFSTQNFTIETWFKVSNSNNMMLLTKRPVCAHSNFWSLSIVSGKLVFEVDENTAGLNYNNLYSVSTITPGTWYHVAVTRSGLTLKIYVNGVFESSVTQTNITNLINTAYLQFGQGPCSSFIGQLDETRFWSRALSSCEINSLRNCEVATSFNGLLANYHYNQGNAGVSNPTMNYVLDATGNSHTAYLNNFTLSGSTSNWVANGAVVSGQSYTNNMSNVPRAYITNQNNSNVVVYDLNTNTEIAKVNIGTGGYGVACTPNGESVYVSNVTSNKICIIDAFTHTLKAQVSVGLFPYGLCIKPDGSRVYSFNFQSNSISVINTSTNTVLTTIPCNGAPFYGACSPNGQFLYVSRSDLNAIAVINTITNTIVANINVGNAPRGIAVSPDGTKIYVCNSSSASVSVIQASTNTVIATIPVGNTPVGVNVSPLGDHVLVSNINSGTVSKINASTNTVSATYTVGTTPRGVSYSQDGKKAYVSNAGSNNLSEINLITNAVSILPNVINVSGNSSIGQFVRYGRPVLPVTACIQYVFGGNTLTTSGLYSANFNATHGCDSTQTINLQITQNTMATPSISLFDSTICSGESVSMIVNSNYCIPTLGVTGNTNGYIHEFEFNYQLINSSGDGDYTFYPLNINAIADSHYVVHLTSGGSQQYFAAYIDYNGDGDFLDANELIGSTNSLGSSINMLFAIPANAKNGVTRLRLLSGSGSVPLASNACSYSGAGEYEDYPITISGGATGNTTSWSPSTFLNATNQAIVSASNIMATTTYTVTVSENAACTKTATKTILVNPQPSITILSSSNEVCTGGSLQLKAVTSPICTPTLGLPGNTLDYISNFNFDNQIINSSGDGDYSFFPLTANVNAGSTYNFNMSAGSFIQYFALFVDYNQDGDFNDANEFVWNTNNYNGSGSGNINIPLNAFNGITRLRVMSCYGQAPNPSNSCSFPLYGEYEDYLLNISGASNGNTYSWSPVTFLNATNQPNVTASGVNASTTYIVTVSNNLGCSASASQSITVFPPQPITLVASSISVCAGSSTQMEVHAANYCTPTLAHPGSTLFYIAAFNFANQIVNTSLGGGSYTNYPLTANVIAGNTYSFQITSGQNAPWYALYIDFNQDGDFTDANEYVWNSVPALTPNGSIIIPTTALNGKTRMRLVCDSYTLQAQNACSNTSYGEYEDYSLNITGGTNGNTYSWLPTTFLNNTTQQEVTATNINANTTYTVMATDLNGCTATATKSINVIPIPSISAGATNPNLCNGASTQLQAIQGNYCIPTIASPGNTNDFISLFQFANQINNVSGDGDYTNYLQSANVQTGNSYYLNVVAGGYPQRFALFIDYNQDNDFNDSNELAWFYNGNVPSSSGYINIPTSARNGLTKLRVVSCAGTVITPQLACSLSAYGEYEDYRLIISGGTNNNSMVWSPATYLNSTNQNLVTASNVTANTIYTVTVTNSNGCTNTSTVSIQVTPCTTSGLEVKCFIEGYYAGSGLMQAVKMNQGIGSNSSIVDDISLEIKQPTSPYTTVATSTGELNTNGTVQFNFNPIPTGLYFIVLKYKNGIETWSASPVPILTSSTYDFTTAANKAFGSNQTEVANGVWALYSGDINQDGSIDAFDYILQDPDIIDGASGYLSTDLNGDGIVDVFDYLVMEPNLTEGIGAITP